MNSIKKPAFTLVYKGRDITEALGIWPVEITYIDKKHGESDDTTVKVHNTTGQWLDDWSPKKGDTFTLDYGYDDNQVSAGTFTVDSITAEGSSLGDTVTFKGLATAKTQALRSKEHKAYEQQNLKEIVEKIAGKHGYTVEGDIDDIRFERVTQNGERDLEFLKRLADDYGHYFTTKGKKLIFTERNQLRARDPVRQIDRTAHIGQTLRNYNLKDDDTGTASKAKVTYVHPQRKKVVKGEASTVEDLGIATSSGDVVKSTARVENEEQANRVAKSRLDNANAGKVSGDLELVGDPLLCAGQIVQLRNFGDYDGRYLISESTHTMRRSGYTTKIKVERVTSKQRKDGEEKKKRAGGKGSASRSAQSPGTIVEAGSVSSMEGLA